MLQSKERGGQEGAHGIFYRTLDVSAVVCDCCDNCKGCQDIEIALKTCIPAIWVFSAQKILGIISFHGSGFRHISRLIWVRGGGGGGGGQGYKS